MGLRIVFFCAFLFTLPAVVSPGDTGPKGKGAAESEKNSVTGGPAAPTRGKVPIHLQKGEISGGTMRRNPSYPMPEFRPDPKINYKIMVMVPNPNIDYKIQVVFPSEPRTFGFEAPQPPVMPSPPVMPRFHPRLK
jgi:hypothetical protein